MLREMLHQRQRHADEPDWCVGILGTLCVLYVSPVAMAPTFQPPSPAPARRKPTEADCASAVQTFSKTASKAFPNPWTPRSIALYTLGGVAALGAGAYLWSRYGDRLLHRLSALKME